MSSITKQSSLVRVAGAFLVGLVLQAGSPAIAQQYQNCQPGKYNAPAGTVLGMTTYTCVACPPGAWSPGGPATACTPCPSGRFSQFPGSSQCTMASPGYYVAAQGATMQTACAPGSFSPSSGMPACNPAPKGQFVATPAGTRTYPCNVGTFASQMGSTQCAPAPPGYSVPGQGAQVATMCAAGTFSGAPGAASCAPCAAGMTSLAGAAICTAPVAAAPAGWTNMTFRASDIAVGANGAVWCIGPPGNVFTVNASGAPVSVANPPGIPLRIAVDPAGAAWVVNNANAIYKLVSGNWQQITGATARDIGVGANGKVWIVDSGAGGAPKVWNGTDWTSPGGGLMQISVDPNGNPYGTNAGNQIYRHVNGQYELLPGAAPDIGVGPDGSIYSVGMAAMTGGSQIYKWNEATRAWETVTGVIGSVPAPGPSGSIYVARSLASGLPVIKKN